MLKFVTKEDEVVPSSTDPEGLSSCTVTDAGCSTEASPSTSYEGTDAVVTTGDNLQSGSSSIIIEKPSLIKEVETDVVSPVSALQVDPSLWPSRLTDSDRLEIVQRGPFKVESDFSFPKDKDGRGFNSLQCYRILTNGEKVLRSWLIYSKQKNCVFCFACKLFSTKDTNLSREGFSDWSNLSKSLRSHDNALDHTQSMLKWRELEMRLKNKKTIDHQELTLLEAEKKRWRDVLTRLVSITISLASRNLAFRGSSDRLYEANSGNFLKEVELLALFDPVMENHLSRVKDKSTRTHYLGQQIQNELIQLISDKILKTIVSNIHQAKYYSIILDCTPDTSHKEQMSVILRTVALEPKPEVKEYFLGYVEVFETTGLNLSNVILDKLQELQIPFENCRGQAYDNGANMKGKSQGVQARLLKQNPRALFVPCGAHSMNLVIADAAKASKDAVGYFGYVQKLFTFFSGATQRWNILLKHVHLTLKSWSDVRWESRLQSITAVRHQVKEIRNALIEARQAVNDPVAKVEAQALAEEVASFRQSGFVDAQSTAKELCEALNIEPELKEKRLRSTKRHFAYEAADEPISDALKKLEVTFFNSVVDSALASLQERFEIFTQVKDRFGVLLDFSQVQGMSKETLQKHCTEVEKTLTAVEKGGSDIDGQERAQEIINLPQLPPLTTALEMLSFLHDNHLQELYPNLWIALRIAVTLPVTVASAERSFLK
ncbi:Zinc finger MYM-type protein 1 [Labeo rohita]|uniref:Zinc finger MYM-type protein 1 n=1 Tax=Labeo rohita TaxID=84645 RepID=A0ABQ8LB36_LABRO|nr:Zinc finger MYM-type protein 1 [Labeo rohita]